MATAHATTIAVKAAGASGSWDASGGTLVDARTAAIRRMIMNPIMHRNRHNYRRITRT